MHSADIGKRNLSQVSVIEIGVILPIVARNLVIETVPNGTSIGILVMIQCVRRIAKRRSVGSYASCASTIAGHIEIVIDVTRRSRLPVYQVHPVIRCLQFAIEMVNKFIRKSCPSRATVPISFFVWLLGTTVAL